MTIEIKRLTLFPEKNNVKPGDNCKDDGSRRNIKGFTYQGFLNMETEYESSSFRQPYENNTIEKMVNICCNVIANGNFKSSDKTDYLTKWKIKL